MFYNPTYCNNCGEKVEREGTFNILKSSHFCDVCANDFPVQEWMPKILIAICMFFGTFGIGSYLLSGEPAKQLDLKPNKKFIAETNVNGELPANKSANIIQPNNQSIKLKAESEQLVTANKSAAVTPKPEPVKIAADKIYFCGAATKKGTPCSRKVKGGGRCWQHAGQDAMLPPEKLLAAQ